MAGAVGGASSQVQAVCAICQAICTLDFPQGVPPSTNWLISNSKACFSMLSLELSLQLIENKHL